MSKFHLPYRAAGLVAVICLGGGFLGGGLFLDEPESRISEAEKEHLPTKAIAGREGGVIGPSKTIKPGSRLGVLERIAATKLAELPDLSRELLSGPEVLDYSQVKSLCDRWIELDARQGLEFFLTERKADGNLLSNVVANEFCGRWALVDPDAAFAAALEIDDEERENVAMDRISMALSSHHPADFFRLLASPGGEAIGYWRSAAARLYGMTNPREAVEALSNIDLKEIGVEGTPVSADLASGWAKNDPDAALAWVQSLSDDAERSRALRAIAIRLIDTDPVQAGEIFEQADAVSKKGVNSHNLLGDRNYSRRAAARILRNKSPAAAIAWVAEYDPASAGHLIPELLPQDAISAVDALASLPESILDDGRLPRWPREGWQPKNLEAAVSKVASLPESKQRESIQAWLLSAMVNDDPVTALDQATRDLSDPANRKKVIGRAVEQWAWQDASKAAKWLSSQEAGPETDAGIVGLINVASHSDPGVALEWAAELSDSETRTNQLISIVHTVKRNTGGDAARAIMEGLTLNDAEREIFVKRGLIEKEE